MKSILFLSCLLAISGHLRASIHSITDLVYKSKTVTVTFTHDYCKNTQFQLKIAECWSGYPLSCEASILPSSDLLDCTRAKHHVTQAFPIPENYWDTAFVLRLKLANESYHEVIVSQDVHQEAIIQKIELIPVTDAAALLTGYQYHAEIQLGANSCYANGTDVSIESAIEDDKVVLMAYREFSQIKNQFSCGIEGYEPVTKIESGHIHLKGRNLSKIIVKNFEKINHDQIININEEGHPLGH